MTLLEETKKMRQEMLQHVTSLSQSVHSIDELILLRIQVGLSTFTEGGEEYIVEGDVEAHSTVVGRNPYIRSVVLMKTALAELLTSGIIDEDDANSIKNLFWLATASKAKEKSLVPTSFFGEIEEAYKDSESEIIKTFGHLFDLEGE